MTKSRHENSASPESVYSSERRKSEAPDTQRSWLNNSTLPNRKILKAEHQITLLETSKQNQPKNYEVYLRKQIKPQRRVLDVSPIQPTKTLMEACNGCIRLNPTIFNKQKVVANAYNSIQP